MAQLLLHVATRPRLHAGLLQRLAETHVLLLQATRLHDAPQLPAKGTEQLERFFSLVEQAIEHGQGGAGLAAANEIEYLKSLFLPAGADQSIHVLRLDPACVADV